jgi:hypothetical protein
VLTGRHHVQVACPAGSEDGDLDTLLEPVDAG